MEKKRSIITGGEIGRGRGIALVLPEDASMLTSEKCW